MVSRSMALEKMPSCRGRRERLRGEWSLGKGGRQGGSKQAHCGWWRENNIIDNYNNHNVVPVYLVVGFSNGVISNDLVSISNGQCENTLILAILDDFA